MRLVLYGLTILSLTFVVGCNQNENSAQSSNKLGELYVETISDASNWSAKPTFLAITDNSFYGLDQRTKKWILTKLDQKYEEVYMLEAIKNDKDKIEYENINGKKTLVRVIDGMTIEVEIQKYEESIATVKVTARKGRDVGIVPIYEAIYKDGNWQIEKKCSS